MKKKFEHPFWLVGFRPLFFLAFVSGSILPVLWAMILTGNILPPLSGIAPMHWHAHEMLFGFGWAILGGFLLTASKNWLKIRGMHGKALAFAFFLWIFERGTIYFVPYQDFSKIIQFFMLNSFIVYVGGYVACTLIWYRRQDTFSDNYFFIAALPLFVVSKILILSPETFNLGSTMAIGLYRVAFVVMFERTITQFMKNAMKVNLIRNKYLDLSIKIFTLIAVFQAFLPSVLAIATLTMAATLLLIRFVMWKPLIAIKRFEIGIMYVGYFGLIMHLFIEAIKLSGINTGVGTIATHTFTFLCMGLIIPAMLIRICQGHTGRPLVFTTSDKFAIWFMVFAAFSRLVATQILPSYYITWIFISGLGWSLCFLIIGQRLIPFLFQKRLDGRIH